MEKAKEKQPEVTDYKEALQRLQAEFENYKKRCDKEKAQFREYAVAGVIKSFLPVLDSFELALKSSASASNEFRKGLELIYAQFYSVLEGQGLKPIKAVGGKLDPYRHEVLMQEATPEEGKDGLVVEEFQKGYLFADAVLRYSKVKVLKFTKVDGAEK